METSGFKTFTSDELHQIATRVSDRLRHHDGIEGGVSVRGSISFLEILEAMSLLKGSITIQDIYDSAFSTFGGRIRSKGLRKVDDILQEVLDEILLGKKPNNMWLSPQSFDEGLTKNIQNLIHNLLTLSVANEYGPPIKEEPKTGIYTKDLLALLDDKNRKNLPTLNTLTEALRNAVNQSPKNDEYTSEAIKSFLNNLEKFNLVKQDSSPGKSGKYKFTKGAIGLVGKKTAIEILKDHYEELLDNNSGEDAGKSISREELPNLLNDLQILLDIMRSNRLVHSIESLMHNYKDQLPTLSKVLQELASVLVSHPFQNPWETSSGISAAFSAILEALQKEQYVENKREGIVLSNKAYEMVFQDVLPEVEKASIRGEHDILTGDGDWGEVIDIRKYRLGDKFRDIAIGATIKEMAKHRRRQPKTEDFRTNKLLSRRSLDLALTIDTSRSMALHGKLLYAKKAAIGLALAAIKKGDNVRLLAFSDFTKNLGNLIGNANRQFLKSVADLMPLNSTNVEDALMKTAKSFKHRQMGGQKHIIIITDGVPTSCAHFFNTQTYPQYSHLFEVDLREISMKAAYIQAQRCLAQGITISAICVDRGEYVNKDFCRNLSKLGKGRAYFLKDEKLILKTTLREYLLTKYS
ncbi:VWA domain-containing protein [Candidatus Bathyarchaeota archaeon]|nr:VWA domain-containing protein [Candidatus Bathyarchaeota archaeon]